MLIYIIKQADILYDNMDSALSAISLFREGKSEYRDLGDWSQIIHLFDPYRDRHSVGRLQKLLNEIVLA